MTRQRIFQKQYEEQGLCGNCSRHSPIFRGSKCRRCYRMCVGRIPRNQLLRNKTLKNLIKSCKISIGRHLSWVEEHEVRGSQKLADKHRRWIEVHVLRVQFLESLLQERLTSARAASSPASSRRRKSCSSGSPPLLVEGV